MLENKELLSSIAILLTFVGYIPYVRDTIKGKTKPHVYSWFLWFSVTTIIFALQISDGGGAGAFVSLAAALAACLVFVLGLRNGKKDITVTDNLCLVLAIIATILWLYAEQPLISAILLTCAEVIAFLPTIRKSWSNPYSETVSFYLFNTVRLSLAVLALENYTVITALYPVTWVLLNGLFGILLLFRRRAVDLHK